MVFFIELHRNKSVIASLILKMRFNIRYKHLINGNVHIPFYRGSLVLKINDLHWKISDIICGIRFKLTVTNFKKERNFIQIKIRKKRHSLL